MPDELYPIPAVQYVEQIDLIRYCVRDNFTGKPYYNPEHIEDELPVYENLVACYILFDNTVYIRDEDKFRNPEREGKSVLIHELVHYMQNIHIDRYAMMIGLPCMERQAYFIEGLFKSEQRAERTKR
jgi:hypothetical protein